MNELINELHCQCLLNICHKYQPNDKVENQHHVKVMGCEKKKETYSNLISVRNKFSIIFAVLQFKSNKNIFAYYMGTISDHLKKDYGLSPSC